MKDKFGFDRRQIVFAAAAGALAPGLSLHAAQARAASGTTRQPALTLTPEVSAWILIQPDDKAIIRVVQCRSGLETHASLYRFVLEEFGVEWSAVAWELPTRDPLVARQREWGDLPNAGARIHGARAAVSGLPVIAVRDYAGNVGGVGRIDALRVKTMPGVRNVVKIGASGVGVIADAFSCARTALAALPLAGSTGADAVA